MLAVIAGVIFIIGAIVAWADPSVSVPHLVAIIAAGLAFLAGHLAFRVWAPDGRHW